MVCVCVCLCGSHVDVFIYETMWLDETGQPIVFDWGVEAVVEGYG